MGVRSLLTQALDKIIQEGIQAYVPEVFGEAVLNNSNMLRCGMLRNMEGRSFLTLLKTGIPIWRLASPECLCVFSWA